MQQVSENWKDIHKRALLNESFVEVSLDITEPDAFYGVSSTPNNGAIYISNPYMLNEGMASKVPPTPYCTLEQNMWCLDGKRKAIPESDYKDWCYISDVLSDDTCIFSTKLPVITINFSRVFDGLMPGITITWSNAYGEFADTFSVIVYNGTNVVTEKEVVGNKSVKSVISMDFKYYDRIEIIIKKWCLPNHRARVDEIFVGLNKVFGKAELFDYSHTQSVDPVSTSLPKNEIRFSIENVNGEYNPYNTDGFAKYLTERQEIKTRYGLKMDDGSIEWIKGGTFYLSEWYAKQNGMTADFTARDLFEFMSAIYYDDEYWDMYDPRYTWASDDGEDLWYEKENTRINLTNEDGDVIYTRSLYELADKVLRSANLPIIDGTTAKWIIDESLKTMYTTAPLPEDTLANCLQLIANAGECVIYQDREGTIHIEPLKDDIYDYKIDSFNSYSKSEITLSKPIKDVSVKLYTYSVDISKYTAKDGFMKAFDNNTSDVTVNIGISGETITLDNPLITDSDRATSVANWLATHLGHRMSLDSSWRADVRLDALDIVTNENNYNTNQVRMTEVEFKYNGAFRGTGKGKVI